MVCLGCSRTLPDDAAQCPSCGAAVGSVATPTATFALTPVPLGSDSPPRETMPRPPQLSHVFAPGVIIAGRYRVVNLLGKGGMGEVYRADDLTLNQPVAMKFLPHKLASDQAALARFHGEVRVARNVSHLNVCRVFDVGESEGRIFLTMEYIDGEDLAVLLRRIGRLPSDKATELARQICAGVGAAHDAGVLHRDLKPANIMVDGRGRAHVTDFGVAGLAEDLKEDASFAGTLAYMAPEQLAGKGASTQSDVFSLGLILYEMFTGRRAFEGGSITDLMRAHQDSVPSRPSTLIGDVDPIMDRVILQCLDRNPAARPRTAQDVARALPGGDPLAAAMAAGETPSPEMVAASGGVGSLAVGKAWAMLAGALLLLVACLALAPWSTELGLAPLENSPDVMIHRAQELAHKFGYEDAPKDTAFWYARNFSFLTERARNLPPSDKFGDLKSAPQGHTKFYYRQSPLDMLGWNIDWAVKDDSPPLTLTGMVTVGLEPDGSLDLFLALPPQIAPVAAETHSATDWNALFAESGLDPKRFEPEPPAWISPVPFDASMGWKGSYAQDPTATIHVSAAAFRGQPVYFQVIAPWNTPDRDVPNGAEVLRLRGIVAAALTATLLAVGVFLAWRNLNQGRGDLKGALRLAIFVLAAQMFAWLCQAHHQSAPASEWLLFVLGLGFALLYAGQALGAYLAVEPYVRRRMPELLTSWTRLVSGGWRDPLVGRDVLIGVLAAVGYIVVLSAGTTLLMLLNSRVQLPRQFFPWAMVSFASAIGTIPWNSAVWMVYDLGAIFLLFLVRAISKRRWVAEIIVTIVFAATSIRAGDYPAFAIIWAASLVLLCRVGLLAAYAFDTTRYTLQFFPLTFHPSHWYFSRSMAVVAFCVGLAVYGFYISLGGKSPFGGGRGFLSFSDE
jgi:Protein kinase domain